MTAAAKYVPTNIRGPLPDDEGFIYNSWLKSLHESSPWAKYIRSQIFYNNHKKVLAKILSESGVLIACNPEMPDQIFGYGVYQPSSGGVAVIHYLYVKHPYRKLGIGKELFRQMLALSDHNTDLPAVASHIADPSVWWDIKDKFNLVYNPYVIGALE